MDILKTARCISTPFRPPALIPHSRLANAVPLEKKPRNIRKCRNMCAASNSDTILKSSDISSKKEEDYGDLKCWMEKNGLPPSKVMLKERPSHDSNYHSIHYVAASENLQVSSLQLLVAVISILQRKWIIACIRILKFFCIYSCSPELFSRRQQIFRIGAWFVQFVEFNVAPRSAD